MDKTVLVTGGSRGIGAATALLFGKKGYRVAINYCQSPERAQQVKQQIEAVGGTAAYFGADVADKKQVQTLFAAVEKELGPVDVLVNNAAVARQELFQQVSEGDYRRMMGVNLDGAVFCCQRALPHMIGRQWGKIVNLSSVWGLAGASCEVVYATTKAALIGLTKSLAKELGPSGIQVNCVAPGVIDTEMNGNLSPQDLQELADETPLCRLGTPQDVANCILFLCSDEASFVTGQVLSPGGGFYL